MAILFFEIFILLLFVTWKLYRNIYNPTTVCLLTWGGLIFMYNLVTYNKSNCRILSDRFYLYIILFLTFFSFSNFCINGFYKNTIPPKLIIPKYSITDKRIKRICYLCLLINLILILSLIKMCGTANPVKLIAKMRFITQYEENTIPIYVKLLMYLFQMTAALFCYISLEKITKHISIMFFFSP